MTALRGSLNRLLADTLVPPPTTLRPGAGVQLHLNVSRQIAPGVFEPVVATHKRSGAATRDMKKVPPPPDQVRFRTGEQVRVEVVADHAGYLTVFNVGPTGHLNVLHPGDASPLSPAPIGANRPLEILNVEMTPPAGRERLVAVWSREPLRFEQLAGLGAWGPGSSPYRATRDMKRVQESVQQVQPDSRHVVVVEVEHVA